MSVVLAERTGRVVTLTINRPEAANALNADVLIALSAQVEAAAADPSIRAVVITGAGEKAFSAGADLREIAAMTADEARESLTRGQRILRAIESAPVPVIAAVNGLALGGGFELALAATFPILATHAELGLPESGLGLIPGYGGTQRLARVVGAGVAAHLMLTGARVDAARAYELRLTPLPAVAVDDLVSTARSVADEIAARGPQAVRAILGALEFGRDAPLDTGLAAETGLAVQAVLGAESTEGIGAFLERRRAVFADPELSR